MSKSIAGRRAALEDLSFKRASARLRQPTNCDAAALHRVRGEFREMPGLSLTLAQATRLFGLPEAECLGVLRQLVDDGVLGVRLGGRYLLKVSAA